MYVGNIRMCSLYPAVFGSVMV